MKFRSVLLCCLLWVFSLACADETESFQTSQVSLSGISAEHAQELREVLNKFSDDGAHNVNVAGIAQTVTDECLRNFAGAFANESMVIEGQSLDLTESGVLPKTDGFGDYDPTGGYVEFVEFERDEKTDEDTEKRVHKRSREFTAGSVKDFEMTRTKDSPDGYSLHDREQLSFKVKDEVEYQATAWHQVLDYVEEGFDISERSYKYNSLPVARMTLSSGSHAMSLKATDDLLESASGWSTTHIEQSDMKISGTLTLYQPKKLNAASNTNEAAAYEEEKTVEDGFEVTVGVETTLEKTIAPGPVPELETQTIVVRTVSNTDKVEPSTAFETGRLVFTEREEHTTSNISYLVVEGKGAEALKTRALEHYEDHVVTERVITTTETVYEGDGIGNYVRTTTTSVYRYTDNPATRNDIVSWMSTQSTDVETVDVGEGVDETARGGAVWLTDQIQVDPEFDQVPFVWDGGTKVVTICEGRFFGADSSGFESSEDVETDYSVSAGFGSSSVKVSGTYAVRGASISNGSGDAHSLQGDVDGTMEVEVAGSSYTVSAEEWVGWISP